MTIMPACSGAPPRVLRRWSAEAALRLVLAVLFAIVPLLLAAAPEDRPVSELFVALSRGQVIAVQTPPADQIGAHTVRWSTGTWQDYDSVVRVSEEDPQLLLRAARTSPREVRLSSTPDDVDPWVTGELHVNWPGVALLAGLFVFVPLFFLGREPAHATRWAWFWLSCTLPVSLVVYLLIEPLPLWRRHGVVTGRPRLTGGWALLAGLVIAGLGRTYAPALSGVLWTIR